jgi:hypothetical protein
MRTDINRRRWTTIETLEGRALMADTTGFFPTEQLQGETAVTLHPIESVSPGVSTRVTFGVPFPKGFLSTSDLSKLRLLTSTGTEQAVHVQLLTSWRDMGTLTDFASVRSAQVQADVTFTDVDADGDADPVNFKVEWGVTSRTLAALTPIAARSNWVQYNNAAAPAGTDFKTADNVLEPPAYAMFTPEWYGMSMLKTRLLPAGTDAAFAGYDQAYSDFAATAINDVDPRVTAANLIHYTNTDEPWLFDRATALYQLAFRTGEVEYLRHAHRGAQFYANHIGAQGYFDLKGDDIKYVTGEAISIDYWLTGDDRMLAVHQRMIPMFDNGQTATYTPGHFWTERHNAYKLLGYVTGYELLGTASLGQKAKDTFTIYVNHQNNPPAGAPNTGMLMHQKPDHGEGGSASEWVASPWMSVFLIDAVERYYIHSGDTRVANFVTRMADGINQIGDSMYYTDAVDGNEHLTPFYLAGPGLSDQGHELDEWGDLEHAVDVSKIFALAYYFSKRAGSPSSAYLGRFNELVDSSQAAFNYWTRPNGPASGLAAFRLSPARKFNWWFRTTANRDFLIGAGAPTTPDTEDPHLILTANPLNTAGAAFYTFTITYIDNRGIDTSTIDSQDVRVTRSNGFDQLATLISVNQSSDGTPRIATYRVNAPSGTWGPADDGTYAITMQSNQVADTAGRFVVGEHIGTFTVSTANALTLSGVAASGVTSNGATVTWTSDQAADSQVEYGTTSLYGTTTSLDAALVTGHSVALTGLTPNTVYHFRVLSRRADGTLGSSADFTFTTPASSDGGGGGGGGGGTEPQSLGAFGLVDGRTVKLTFTDADGTVVTASLTGGGIAQAYLTTDGRVDLDVTGTGAKSSLSFKTKGGDGRVLLGDVRVTGAIRTVNARTADLGGTMSVAGALGALSLASMSGGMVAAAGDIGSVVVAGASSGGTVMSGMDLGADGALGGAGSDADTQHAGAVRKLKMLAADGDGTVLTATLAGAGSITATVTGGLINIELTGTGLGSVLNLSGKGGDGRVALGNVHAAGAMKTLLARTSDLAGTVSVDGSLGSLSLGNLGGGTVAVARDIGNIDIGGVVTNGRILAGIRLGSDRQFGGSGEAADVGVGGSIRKLSLRGSVSGGVFSAGVLPGSDETYGGQDDILAGGTGSAIVALTAKGSVDPSSRFSAGMFGTVRLAQEQVDLASDGRFHVVS